MNKAVRRLRKRLRQISHLKQRAEQRELNEEEQLKLKDDGASRRKLAAEEALLRAEAAELYSIPPSDEVGLTMLQAKAGARRDRAGGAAAAEAAKGARRAAAGRRKKKKGSAAAPPRAAKVSKRREAALLRGWWI